MTDAVRTAGAIGRTGFGTAAGSRSEGRIDASAYLRERNETGARDGAGSGAGLGLRRAPASALRAARAAAA
jgi:hypothetical protein